MLNLVKNEIYKFFRTKKLYVFMLIVFVYNFLPSLEKIVGTIDEANVIINGQNTAFYMLNFMITNIMPLFIIVSIADMVTGEYVNGTLNIPLIHPVSRIKLLTAKAIALFIPLICLLIFSLLLSYAMGTLIFGWGNQFVYQEVNQSIKDATVYSTQEGIVVTLGSYFISIFPLLAFGMMVMFFALFFNSSGVLVGISLGFLIFLSILGEVVQTIRPYLIINSFSLFKMIFVSQNINDFISTFIITAFYGLGFYFASIYSFSKKDLTY